MISSTLAVIKGGSLKSGDAKSQATKKVLEQFGQIGKFAENVDNAFLYTNFIQTKEQGAGQGHRGDMRCSNVKPVH